MTTATPSASPPGWYTDPHAPGSLRYFDGGSWTEHVAPASAPSATVVPSASPSFAPHVRPPSAGIGSAPSDPLHWLVPSGRTWQSIVAGYVGLFAIVLWFLGPIAVGFGAWALVASSKGGRHGRGRAIFAIVAGFLATLAMIALFSS